MDNDYSVCFDWISNNNLSIVGSANITIVPEKNNMLKITIFNITSLTSGAFWKEIAPNEMLYQNLIWEIQKEEYLMEI